MAKIPSGIIGEQLATKLIGNFLRDNLIRFETAKFFQGTMYIVCHGWYNNSYVEYYTENEWHVVEFVRGKQRGFVQFKSEDLDNFIAISSKISMELAFFDKFGKNSNEGSTYDTKN